MCRWVVRRYISTTTTTSLSLCVLARRYIVWLNVLSVIATLENSRIHSRVQHDHYHHHQRHQTPTRPHKYCACGVRNYSGDKARAERAGASSSSTSFLGGCWSCSRRSHIRPLVRLLSVWLLLSCVLRVLCRIVHIGAYQLLVEIRTERTCSLCAVRCVLLVLCVVARWLPSSLPSLCSVWRCVQSPQNPRGVRHFRGAGGVSWKLRVDLCAVFGCRLAVAVAVGDCESRTQRR